MFDGSDKDEFLTKNGGKKNVVIDEFLDDGVTEEKLLLGDKEIVTEEDMVADGANWAKGEAILGDSEKLMADSAERLKDMVADGANWAKGEEMLGDMVADGANWAKGDEMLGDMVADGANWAKGDEMLGDMVADGANWAKGDEMMRDSAKVLLLDDTERLKDEDMVAEGA